MKKFRKPHRIKRLQPTRHILLRQRRRHLKSIFRNRSFWLGILILIICGGIFYLICFASFFQIKKIEISGKEQKVLFSEIQKTIDEKIGQKILSFPSKSIFLVNFNQVRQAFLEKFPQIAKVNLKRNFPDKVIVQIEERKPVAIFGLEEKYFFIDKEGVIFEPASEEREYLKIKSLNLNQPLNLGQKALEKELLTLILEVKEKIHNDFKIPLTEILLVSEETISFKTLEDWEIYFNFKNDLAWQLTKLKAVLDKEIPQEKRKDLEYIDVRFGNLAPYKYR